MDKLKLNLDDLSVESFDTTPDASREFGTVRGYNDSFGGSCEGAPADPCSGDGGITCALGAGECYDTGGVLVCMTDPDGPKKQDPGGGGGGGTTGTQTCGVSCGVEPPLQCA